MVRLILAAGSAALALAAAPTGLPAVAQQSPAPEQPSTQKVDPTLVGLSVYSSDGHKLGQVSDVGLVRGQPAVRAEIGQFLGMGSSIVIIPSQTFQRKADRIEVALTAQEVKDTISRQQKEKEDKQQ